MIKCGLQYGDPHLIELEFAARMRTNNKLNPHITLSPGIEPRPHWWEASALTTVPSPDIEKNIAHCLYGHPSLKRKAYGFLDKNTATL